MNKAEFPYPVSYKVNGKEVCKGATDKGMTAELLLELSHLIPHVKKALTGKHKEKATFNEGKWTCEYTLL